MRMVISDAKTGKSYNTEVEKGKEVFLIGKKIGDTFDGGFVGISGFKLELTGGSDKDGFPMRPDISGQARTQALIGSGPGVHTRFKGEKRKKTVCGNTISQSTMQVNCKVVEYVEGKNLAELVKIAPKKERK
jgi:small subunit ribosomal protein S6e